MKTGTIAATGLRGIAGAISACLFVSLLWRAPVGAAELTGAGAKVSFVATNETGAGIGIGGHALVRLLNERSGAIDLFPNLVMWYGVNELAGGGDKSVFEVQINLDGRYCFPLPEQVKVRPFAGVGLAPVIDSWSSDSGPPQDGVSGGLGINIFCGTDLPIGPAQQGFLEVRGKLGVPGDKNPHAFMLTFGVLFSPPTRKGQ